MSNPSRNPDRQRARLPGPVLFNGQQLFAGEALTSQNGRLRAVMQGDGNFVVYEGTRAIWATGTNGRGALRVFLDLVGNVCLESPSEVVWQSRTGNGDSALVMQDDGNLVLYVERDGKPYSFAAWSSKGGKVGHSTWLSSALSVAGLAFPVAFLPVVAIIEGPKAAVEDAAALARAAGQVAAGNLGGAAATLTGAVGGALADPPASAPPIALEPLAPTPTTDTDTAPPAAAALRWETLPEWWRRVARRAP